MDTTVLVGIVSSRWATPRGSQRGRKSVLWAAPTQLALISTSATPLGNRDGGPVLTGCEPDDCFAQALDGRQRRAWTPSRLHPMRPPIHRSCLLPGGDFSLVAGGLLAEFSPRWLLRLRLLSAGATTLSRWVCIPIGFHLPSAGGIALSWRPLLRGRTSGSGRGRGPVFCVPGNRSTVVAVTTGFSSGDDSGRFFR
jgi:hypothetical protein